MKPDHLKSEFENNHEMTWAAIVAFIALIGCFGGLWWKNYYVFSPAALALLVCIVRLIKLLRISKVRMEEAWKEDDQYTAMVSRYGRDLAARRFKSGLRD